MSTPSEFSLTYAEYESLLACSFEPEKVISQRVLLWLGTRILEFENANNPSGAQAAREVRERAQQLQQELCNQWNLSLRAIAEKEIRLPVLSGITDEEVEMHVTLLVQAAVKKFLDEMRVDLLVRVAVEKLGESESPPNSIAPPIQEVPSLEERVRQFREENKENMVGTSDEDATLLYICVQLNQRGIVESLRQILGEGKQNPTATPETPAGAALPS